MSTSNRRSSSSNGGSGNGSNGTGSQLLTKTTKFAKNNKKPLLIAGGGVVAGAGVYSWWKDRQVDQALQSMEENFKNADERLTVIERYQKGDATKQALIDESDKAKKHLKENGLEDKIVQPQDMPSELNQDPEVWAATTNIATSGGKYAEEGATEAQNAQENGGSATQTGWTNWGSAALGGALVGAGIAAAATFIIVTSPGWIAIGLGVAAGLALGAVTGFILNFIVEAITFIGDAVGAVIPFLDSKVQDSDPSDAKGYADAMNITKDDFSKQDIDNISMHHQVLKDINDYTTDDVSVTEDAITGSLAGALRRSESNRPRKGSVTDLQLMTYTYRKEGSIDHDTEISLPKENWSDIADLYNKDEQWVVNNPGTALIVYAGLAATEVDITNNSASIQQGIDGLYYVPRTTSEMTVADVKSNVSSSNIATLSKEFANNLPVSTL